jgi:membrane protein insertase Oxa1/YidC/SpoIIIJ
MILKYNQDASCCRGICLRQRIWLSYGNYLILSIDPNALLCELVWCMGHALGWFWTTVFYAPLFNALIWLYNGPAEQNLGVAIILLTLALRLCILPLTVLSERNKHIYDQVEAEIEDIERAYKNDEEQQKERIRELLRSRRVSPWARTASLGLQALVLVILYQVFMDGIRMNRFDVLYPGIMAPDFVFTNFLGTDLGKHSWFWATIVGVWLFIEISIEHRHRKEAITRAVHSAFGKIDLYLDFHGLFRHNRLNEKDVFQEQINK